MTFNSTISLADIITLLLMLGGLVAFYWKRESGSDERLVKSEAALNNLKMEIDAVKDDCTNCKIDFSKRIRDVEERTEAQFSQLTIRINSMETSLRTDIQNLGQNIINTLIKK